MIMIKLTSWCPLNHKSLQEAGEAPWFRTAKFWSPGSAPEQYKGPNSNLASRGLNDDWPNPPKLIFVTGSWFLLVKWPSYRALKSVKKCKKIREINFYQKQLIFGKKSISRIFLYIFRILEHCAFVVIPLLLLLRIGINFIALTFVTFGVTRILKKKLTSLLWQWLLENCGSSV